MVVLVTLERQADTLDGVGNEADRAIVIDRLEGLAHAGHVVAAEIGHQLQQFVVAAPLDQLRYLRPGPPISSRKRSRNAAPPWKHSAA